MPSRSPQVGTRTNAMAPPQISRQVSEVLYGSHSQGVKIASNIQGDAILVSYAACIVLVL